MASEKQNSGNGGCGGCLGTIIWILILAYILNSCGSDSKNNVKTEPKEDVKIEQIFDFVDNIGSSDKNKKKFIEAGDEFYNLYMDYFGEDFIIDDEPFKNGEYIGDNREKYRELALILDDMCMYYKGIKKQGDRYDALGELDFSMYNYTYNVRQMTILIEDIDKYEEEKFTLEYSDYIVD